MLEKSNSYSHLLDAVNIEIPKQETTYLKKKKKYESTHMVSRFQCTTLLRNTDFYFSRPC